jgi:hypothetical protein
VLNREPAFKDSQVLVSIGGHERHARSWALERGRLSVRVPDAQ